MAPTGGSEGQILQIKAPWRGRAESGLVVEEAVQRLEEQTPRVLGVRLWRVMKKARLKSCRI